MEHKSQITRTGSGNTAWDSGSRSRDFGIETGRALSVEGYPLYVSDYASELGRDFCDVKRTSGGVSSDRKTASPAIPTLRAPLMVQRSPLPYRSDSPTCPSCSTPVTVADSTGAETVTGSESAVSSRPEPGVQQNEMEAPEASTGGLIVDDSVQQLEAGQMRKSDFLYQLRMEVNTTAATAMRGTGRTPENCPYLIFWFGYYSMQSSAHLERALHRYAPETRNATSVRQYMAIVNNRVRRAVNLWVSTGQVTGVPVSIPTQLPSGAGAVGAASANGGGNENGATPAGSSPSKVMAKARNGGARIPNDPLTIQKELGEGNPLSSGVRSNMESAFGSNFSHVRIHTDAYAAGLSNRLNARAFTVGEHIAFGQGQYQPGTPVGDALIAHEVAHVVQQGGSIDAVPILKGKSVDSSYLLENDADNAAVGAVASLWGKRLNFLGNLSQEALPQMRSGLRLQRCCKPTNPTPTITLTQVLPPETQHCGGLNWMVQFGLSGSKSHTEGYIVQKVNQKFDVSDCNGKPVEVKERTRELVAKGFKTTPSGIPITQHVDPAWWPFTEAWKVNKGNIYLGKTSQIHQADVYAVTPMGPMKGMPPTKGKVDIKGSADYYDCAKLPFQFSTGKMPAKLLPIARPPVFPNVSGSGAKDHNIKIRWNCCPDADAKEKKTIIESHTP